MTPPLPCSRALRLGLPTRDGANARAAVHVRGRGRSGEGRDRLDAVRAPAACAESSSVSTTPPPDGIDAVPVNGVVGQLPPALVDLALWLADYYGSTPARALALVAPEQPKRRKIQAPPGERQSLPGEAEPLSLSDEQKVAVARIVSAVDGGAGGPFLLWGATGSGKTEVYLQACAAVLERGLGAIVLVPEIALAPQTVGRVRARFGDRVAILHSALTDAERRDERERIASGEARIVVGARSAVFAPVHGLGLIVVDEEHDSSYKQESDPRYDARTIAAKRAALEGAVAVFGSATPRPESWAVLERLELGGRVSGRAAAGSCGRPAPRSRVPALGAAPARPSRHRRSRWEGDSPSEPPRSGAGTSLPCMRCDDPLPELRRRARAARRRGSPVPSLRPRRALTGRLPDLRIVRAGPARRRDAEARARARARVSRTGDRSARRRHHRESPTSCSPPCSGLPRPTAPSSSGRRWSRRGITSPESSSPP